MSKRINELAVEILRDLKRWLVSTGRVSANLSAGFTVRGVLIFLTSIYLTLWLFHLASTQEKPAVCIVLPVVRPPA